MKSITFTVSKGGVGKSLLTANIGAALAEKGKKVVLVEGDTNKPLEKILGLSFSSEDIKLEDVVAKNDSIKKAVYDTKVCNLSLVPSGISLQGYFEIDPIGFVKKIKSIQADFMLVDVPFPLGKAAFLSLGTCDYFIPILTENEFILCVESTIDTIRIGNYFLKSVPLGFVLNRIKTFEKFNQQFTSDLENLLEIPCIAKIEEDEKVSRSYGEVGAEEAFLAYDELKGSRFVSEIDKVVTWLLNNEFTTAEKDAVKLLESIIKSSKF